jgi:molybdate transport system ATP-binding protein
MDLTNDFIISAEKITVNKTSGPVLKDVSFTLSPGDHLVVTGPSGSGKTTLGLVLVGKMYYQGELHFGGSVQTNIAWVEQQHHFKNLSNTTDFYYQQRFNSSDSEDAQTVGEVLGPGSEMVLNNMQIGYLANKPLIQLSNGENKKLQLAKALVSRPSALIMDQPFTGLDATTRNYLHEMINTLAKQGMLIVLITTPDEIPSCITRVLSLDKGIVKSFDTRDVFLKNYSASKKNDFKNTDHSKEKLKNLSSSASDKFESAIKMKEVKVEYGGKKILDNINWDVKKGERWLLSGPNGAGKSTLLSLVTADNPQAYANNIWLFDKKRGSGESIWDIKGKIGYLSPELHLFFDQGSTCFEAVASGFFDTIGLFRQLSEEHMRLVGEWMSVTGIEALEQKRLFELSAGQQRVVLLTRAMVKNPPLLILDEPCQGLDPEKQAELHELIDAICINGNKTMVFVTHYANERPSCINRFIKLEKGKIVE